MSTHIPYTIVRRKYRRSIAIAISQDHEVRVLAPYHIKESEISQIIQKKSGWITHQLELRNLATERFPKHTYLAGDTFYFRGTPYKLALTHSEKPWVKITDGILNLGIQSSADEAACKIARDQLSAWYQFQAEAYFKARIEELQGNIKKPTGVEIKNQKSKWGSCTNRGKIYLNWRLIMAPDSVIDYVIVHELCHLIHLNHSKSYWSLVKQVKPNFKESRDWLKKNDGMLEL